MSLLLAIAPFHSRVVLDILNYTYKNLTKGLLLRRGFNFARSKLILTLKSESINQSDQSVRLVSQSVSQSVRQTSQSIGHTDNQSISQSYQSVRLVSQSVSQSVSQTD